MPFNSALSGIRAANDDLRVTGNNIANTSTTGFKQSRAEFGDVFLDQIGSGVRVQSISQQFGQANISFTDNDLDLAISGSGFFVTNNDGDQNYTRAGTFGLNQDGYIVNNNSHRLQGFLADDAGNVGGALSDIQIQNRSILPSATTNVDLEVNLDSRESILQSSGVSYNALDGGVLANSNGYPAQDFIITNPDGVAVTITAPAAQNSQTTASELNALPGVSTSIRTTATITNWDSGLSIAINGTTLTSTDIAPALNEINNTNVIPGVTATLSPTNELILRSAVGDLSFAVNNTSDGDTLTIQDSAGASLTLESDSAANGVGGGNLNGTTDNVVIGGALSVNLEENYTLTDNSAVPLLTNGPVGFINNAFDPSNPSTYNHTTSATIFDSLGNPHILQQYYIKQSFDATDPLARPNHWKMAVQIDGADIGDDSLNGNITPSVATFDVYFTPNGTLDTNLTGELLISNWTPLDTDGGPLGALGPTPIAAGGSTPVTEPAISSNFQLFINNTTQVGSSFEVRGVNQNGSTTGRLAGLDIDQSGVVLARFTNGENQILAQIALADFDNPQGLDVLGDTSWSETFESGGPAIGPPNTASLGIIQSNALEDSNVDLSEQLVKLIIAQRNFQASAKTIETADQTTQAIINLR